MFQQSFIAIDASFIPGCSLSTFASKSSLQSGTTDWGTLFLWFLGRAFDGWMSHLNRMLNSYLATDSCTLLFNRFLFVLEGGAGNQHASTPKPNGWIKLLGSFTAKYTFFCVYAKSVLPLLLVWNGGFVFREFVDNKDSFSDADVFSTKKNMVSAIIFQTTPK